MVEQRTDGYLEAALSRAQEAEAKYRSLVELVRAITYVEEIGSGRTYAVSPQVETILGFKQEEWMGEADRWESSIHPLDRDRVIAACDLSNATGEKFDEEYRVIGKHGRLVWIHDEAELVRGAGGEPLCWQGVMTDVTDAHTPEG